MMRLGRSASLLVAFYLLTSAAMAHAECAWVLWEQRDLEDPEPVSAFDDRQSCKRTLDHELARWRDQDPEFVIVRDTTVHFLAVRTETAWWSTMAIRYICLPDTVDPRGAKGK